MNEQTAQEIWQTEVNGVIYEAPFEELTQWIAEGALQPQDKIRRGNLRWIEAGKVPLLYGFFNAKALGTSPPTVVPPPSFQPEITFNSEANFAPSLDPEQLTEDKPCILHPFLPALFFCPTCSNLFCAECPKSIGGGYKNCPMCGARCESIAKVKKEIKEAQKIETALNEGFTVLDFGRALAYPFKFKVSLFFGAILFTFFSIGQHASSLGGRWLISAAIISGMLSNMLTFGILANTVENFLQHKLGQNFMPSFDEFSMWDDVVQPFFLSIGVYVSAFLPFILLLIVMFFAVSSSSKSNDALKEGVVPMFAPEIMPDYQGAKQGKEQIDMIKQSLKMKEEYQKKQREEVENSFENGTQINESNQNFGTNSNLANSTNLPPINDEKKEFEQYNEMINKTRKQQLESTIGKQDTEENPMFGGLFQMVKTLDSPFFFLALVFGGWGLFYLPVAYIVAAYTRNLGSVLNPLIGLDTIKRLGFDYLKILLMGFVLLIFSAVVNLVLSFALSPFDLPRLGNLPVVAITSFFTFYFSIVFSLVLGYALLKNSHKFQMYETS
jgi:hypothetical protein